jgi:hypothetical protein
MEAICSSEKSVATQQTTRRLIPEDDTLQHSTLLCGLCNLSYRLATGNDRPWLQARMKTSTLFSGTPPSSLSSVRTPCLYFCPARWPERRKCTSISQNLSELPTVPAIHSFCSYMSVQATDLEHFFRILKMNVIRKYKLFFHITPASWFRLQFQTFEILNLGVELGQKSTF